VQVAQILMQYDDRVLGGSGWQIFARKMVLNHFLQKFQRRTEYEEKLKSSGTGTVGCVALIKTENSGSHIYRR
jgi:L-asparaginase